MFFKWSDPYLEKKEFQIIPTFMFLCYLMIAPRVSTCHVTTARVPNVATVAVITCGDI